MSAPTRHNEAWRYSDIAAVEAAWPLPAPESIIVPAGGTFARTIIQDSGSIHQLDIAIGEHSAFLDAKHFVIITLRHNNSS